MKINFKILTSLILIMVLSSCNQEDSIIETNSYYTKEDIANIENNMKGKFQIINNVSLIKEKLRYDLNINLENIDFEKSFILNNFQNDVNSEFFYIYYKQEEPLYFIQNKITALNVSKMVSVAKSEIKNKSNNTFAKAQSCWGECYKAVKETLQKAVELDGENVAICDGLNYLGLCDAAIAAAAATICTKDDNAHLPPNVGCW